MDTDIEDIVAGMPGASRETLRKMLALLRQDAKLTPFTKMTWNQLQSPEGLNLDVANVEAAAQRRIPSLQVPPFVGSVHPTEHLTRQLDRLDRVWSLNSEAACRTIVDAILGEAVDTFYHGIMVDERPQEDAMKVGRPLGRLRVFLEVDLEWRGPNKGATGIVDYLLGHGGGDDVDDVKKDSFLIAVEAKKEWPNSAIPQAIAGGGTLLRYRQKYGRSGPVFVILTNATLWNFYCIDDAGVVYGSGPDIVYSKETLPTILRWLRWFIMGAAVTSPRASTVNMTEEEKALVVTSLSTSCLKLWQEGKSVM
ncbi:uncharacterized protein SPPG_07829 [Spizellomyces punctatus DAOM BR117]|uniref:Uncharacterized protein n=1 Tax=Spizellomyces punctatus (strain DAOM BR117) TaxID=645134 RepID=A0A0L0H7S3_SPIPD|nr:uncharacterized protein SPPG_07829 [Spizellomyces punctatus DAOM BR117]KNC97014.1 hypothetical protein SPPG_07829 [Spizellomyces punctatus DAOM BR117]|eukprot:XP_016605054.1 hypothetical protein SPPG_07829 [Spizellomyces punctatus DAOM BR117]